MTASGATLGTVRGAVRSLLERSPAFHQLEPEDQRSLANALVRVSHTAADLIRAEQEDGAEPAVTPQPKALATSLNAAQEFGGTAVDRVAGTTRSILKAVSFEEFVTTLINGVFGALVASSIQQMHAYTDLLDHVATSTSDFSEAATGDDQAKSWLAQQFPDSLEAVPDDSGDQSDGSRPGLILQQRDGGASLTAARVRGTLGLAPDDPAPTSPDALLPLARRRIGQQRQQMLATLVTMGMQRIVIDGGKINAAMRFHIDAQSAARQDATHSLNITNQLSASGSFGVGPWGASVTEQNTIAYVNTEQTQTNEQINASVDLNSSVEILFRSDYVPLNRMANATQVNQIMANSRNPDAPVATTPGMAFDRPPSAPAAPGAAPPSTPPPRTPATSPAPVTPSGAASSSSAHPAAPAAGGAQPSTAGGGASPAAAAAPAAGGPGHH